MPATTPKYAFPYPLGTDLLADGDNAIQALAERVEAILGNGVAGAWTAYVPNLIGFTGSVDLARYAVSGKTVTVVCKITVTAVSAAMGVSLPTSIHASTLAASFRLPIGSAVGPNTFGPVWPATSTAVSFGLSTWGPGVPAAWSNGSVLGFSATYEAA